jgi:hypothetical protein
LILIHDFVGHLQTKTGTKYCDRQDIAVEREQSLKWIQRGTDAGTWVAPLGFGGDLRMWRGERDSSTRTASCWRAPARQIRFPRSSDSLPPSLWVRGNTACREEVEGGTLGLWSRRPAATAEERERHRCCGGEGGAAMRRG